MSVTFENPIIYQGYKIYPSPYGHWNNWLFCHKDYDGPEDKRLGDGKDVMECIEKIEEYTEYLK